MLSSTIPPLLANGISVTLTCVLLALFDWRLALCVFITLPIAFLAVSYTHLLTIRKQQRRGNRDRPCRSSGIGKPRGRGRKDPVSYTHLYNAVVELVNPVADTVSRKTYTGADVDWYVTVSYTHLDVYKRQLLRSAQTEHSVSPHQRMRQ